MKDLIKRTIQKIKGFLKTLWTRKKEKKVWIPTVVVILIALSMLSDGTKTETYTYTLAPREFVQSVSLTGKVIAAKNVDMGFEATGRVNKVYVKVGDRVKAGATLASLANGDYSASLQKNYALVASEDARLRDIQMGNKKEDIALSQDEYVNAQSDLQIAQQSFADQLQDIYAKADDAIRLKVDIAFNNPRSVNPQFKYSIDQNQALKSSLEDQRLRLGEMFVVWSKNISIENLPNIRDYISDVQRFINDANVAISIVTERTNTSDSTYAIILSNKTDIAAARTSFSLAVSTLNQAEIAYKNSKNAVVKAENQLKLKKSGATQEQIDQQRANLNSAYAGVTSAQALIGKTLIRAPFEGVITKVDIKEGEISSPNTPVIGLLNDGEYQIETFVSENDIAKLKVGQVAKVALDAYGRDVFFDAMVISVDPAETLKDGVSTYRTKIQFTTKDERIKSGLTANIEIETDRRQSVLLMPQAGLFLEKGVKKAYTLTDMSCVATTTTSPAISPNCTSILENKKNIKVVDIQTGEINNTGDIEIVGGLKEGDTIIYSPKTTQ